MNDSVLTSNKCSELIIERFKELLSELSVKDSINFWSAEYIGLPQFIYMNKNSKLAIAGGNVVESNITEIEDPSSYDEFRERFIETFVTRSHCYDGEIENESEEESREEFNDLLEGFMMRAPISFYEKFLESEDRGSRWTMLSYPKLPLEVVEFFLTSSDHELRRALASNKFLPLDAIEILSNDSDQHVRKGIAQNDVTPLEILEKISGDTSTFVKTALAKRPDLTIPLFEKLVADGNVSVRRGIAYNKNIPKLLLKKLANDRNKPVRDSVASNPNCPPDILTALADDKHSEIRSTVASHPNTPPQVLKKLANDKEIRFESFVDNKSTTEEVFDILAKLHEDDLSTYKYYYKELAAHPNCSPLMLEKLSKNKDDDIRICVAENENTSEDVLRNLSLDKKILVRLSLLNNKRISRDMLDELEKTLSKSITKISIYDREEIARRENNSIELQRFLLNDKSIKVLMELAENPTTCQECLEKLASRDNPALLEIIAENPNCPDSVIERMTTSPDPDDRRTIGLISPCSVSAKFNAYNDEIMVTYVTQDSLSPELLGKLGREGIDVVRDAAKKNPAYPSWSSDIHDAGLGHPWVEDQLKNASPAIQKAVNDGDLLFYCGKNAKNDILVKSPVVSFLAIKAATSIPIQWLARVAQSDEWIVRAAVASRTEIDEGLRNKLIEDEHPVVSFLARESL